MKVKAMVCPSCAQMHGNEHLEGCPEGFPPGSWLGDYIEGWECARNALVPPLAERIIELEALLQEHHAVGVLDGGKVGDTCPVCTR